MHWDDRVRDLFVAQGNGCCRYLEATIPWDVQKGGQIT